MTPTKPFLEWLFSSPQIWYLLAVTSPFYMAIAEMVLHGFVCFGYHFLIFCKI